MQIERVKITNVMGHDYVEFSPGKMNVVEGNNGTGKSSIITAILSAFQGADKKEATLLRKDAEVGQTVIILDDNTEITKTYTSDGSKLKVSNNSKASDFVNRIRDLASFSPATFLMADPKTQLQLLLEALNVRFTREELNELCKDYVDLEEILKRISLDKNQEYDLNEFGTIRSAFYDERTGLNKAIRVNNATLETLVNTVPAEAVDLDTLKESLSVKEKELQSLNDYKVKRITDEQGKYNEEHTIKTKNLNAELETLAREKEEELRLLHERFEKKGNEIKQAYAQELSEIQTTRDNAVQSINEKFEEHRTPITDEILQLKNQLENFAAIKQQQELMTKYANTSTELSLKSKACDSILDEIDNLKTRKCEHIPINGLHIQKGEITVDGVAFSRVNTERKIRVALSLARLRAGDLKVVCLDNMEALSGEYFRCFLEAAQGTDLQFFVTRVSDTPLTITTDGQELAV